MPIAAKFFQEADCVDGTWHTTWSGTRWVGGISGLAGRGSFAGSMSIEFQVNGKLCSTLGSLTGAASNSSATLTWASTTSTDTCPIGSVPNVMTVKLQR